MPIYQTKSGKWKIENVAGESNTREEAVRRLQAIKARQHAEGAGIRKHAKGRK